MVKMRRNKWITYGLPIMCFVFMLLFGAARVYAASAYGFETDDLSRGGKANDLAEYKRAADFGVPKSDGFFRAY